MSERLRTSDLAMLAAEKASTPLHNVTLEVIDPADTGFDYDALVELVADRIAFVPRYRQLVRAVPGRLANPVWVDDPDFDLRFHVRRSALPRPGSTEQLRELIARIMTRRLDRNRPLWEMYLVEGLEGGRLALLSKSHQILVDGISTVDLGQVLFDVDADPRHVVHDDWAPRRSPSPASLVTGAIRDTVERPTVLLQTARSNLAAARRTAGAVVERTTDVVGALAGRNPAPASPFNVAPSEQRRVVLVRTSLSDYRKIRRVHGGTVNDVILATITGALRSWLMSRAEAVNTGRSLRALVPMSVHDDDAEPTSLGQSVAGHLLSLPVGESSPVVRLHQVSYSLRSHGETGRAVAADRIAGVAGFAPTTFHALGARVALTSDVPVNVVITNVPGPQFPMFAAGAEMVETYPVPPLVPGHALSIGVTSYDGSVSYGITADRDALPDIEVLEQCLTESLDELLDSASESRPRAPRGRKKGDPQ